MLSVRGRVKLIEEESLPCKLSAKSEQLLANRAILDGNRADHEVPAHAIARRLEDEVTCLISEDVQTAHAGPEPSGRYSPPWKTSGSRSTTPGTRSRTSPVTITWSPA